MLLWSSFNIGSGKGGYFDIIILLKDVFIFV